jgi:hypothetical protein
MQKEIEKAFDSTCEVIFGRKIGALGDYAEWLGKHVKGPIERKTLNGTRIYIPNTLFYAAIKGKLVGIGEALELGKKAIPAEEARALTLENAARALAPIKSTTSEVLNGTNISIEEVAACGLSHYCFRSTFLVQNKYCAFCFWPRQSEYAFGAAYLFSSKFCINCHYSSNLVRCFEMSDCNSCSDCYFCHNCENMDNCMFCFNSKSKRYAVCNVEVGREKYMEIKKRVIGRLAEKLGKDKGLDLSIYNIGCGGSRTK